MNPQLDLYDGLYAVKSPTTSSGGNKKIRSSRLDLSSVASSHDSMSDEPPSDDDPIPPVNANGSPQLSCCSSDLSEFENLKLIEK